MPLSLKEALKAESPENVRRAIRGLSEILGEEKVSTSLPDLFSYSHDYWLISLHWLLKGKVPSLPDVVVFPESEEEVLEVVKIAYEEKVPIYPYGGGSGVLGGAIPERGGIVVDLKRLREVKIYEEDLIVEAGAGINGEYLEEFLNSRGYTLGHFPQSFFPSVLGGWISTKATGQFSTKYGGIEDLVLGLRAVVPPGKIVELKPWPRTATGPDLRSLFIGSEGIFGIITKAWLRIREIPEERFFLSFASESLEEALGSVRRILRRGARPAVIRIYDKTETKRHFYEFEEMYGKIGTIIIVEGEKRIAEAEREVVLEEFSGIQVGEGPVKRWLRTRFDVREVSEFAPLGIVMDTIEVGVHWSNAINLYRNVIMGMKSVKGVLVASAHASHFYPEGVCFYFTFAGMPPLGTSAEEFYSKVWERAMRATIDSGGTISHHHGIGRHRVKWLKEELGEAFSLLKKIKEAIDELGLMNPGNMGVRGCPGSGIG